MIRANRPKEDQYRRETDQLRADLVDAAVEVSKSAEAFEQTFGVSPDVARHSRTLSTQFFTDAGELWCSNEEATSRITGPLIDRIKKISETCKKETRRRKQQPNGATKPNRERERDELTSRHRRRR
jgi:uncharacterized protein (DUF4213/DUF364 family)